MKNRSLFSIGWFLFVLLLSITMGYTGEKAQAETIGGVRSHKHKAHVRLENHLFSANSEAAVKLVRIRWYFPWGDTNFANDLYEYDADGRISKIKRWCDPKNESQCQEVSVLTYNASNNVIKELVYGKFFGNKLTLYSKYLFQWNGSVQTGCSIYDANNVLWQKYTYQYENGLMKRRYTRDSANAITELAIYTYNASSQLTKVQYSYSVYPEAFYTFEYGPNGISKEYHYEAEGEDDFWEYGVYEYK